MLLGLRNTDTLDAKNTEWESDFVTPATQTLLDDFEALPDRDRSELVAERARRVALAPHDLPHDADLVAAAARLFADTAPVARSRRNERESHENTSATVIYTCPSGTR